MAGTFELFVDADACFRFRLRAPDGAVLAVSKAFADKPAAVAGITAVREYAGMGLISDLCPAAPPARPPAPRPRAVPAPVPGVDRRVHDNDLRIRARALRRPHGPGAIGVG